MVNNRRGQSTSEFILVLSVLTAIGAFIVIRYVGKPNQPGAIPIAQNTTLIKIATDH